MENARSSAPQRQLSIIAILIVGIATPATLALSYYHITGDPTFRPLAVTVERLVAVGEAVEHIDVQAIVTSDGSPEGKRRSTLLGARLDAAFYGKGLNSHVHLRTQPQPGPAQIYFYVGGNEIGPFDAASAPQGVRIVAEAVAIYRRDQATNRLHSW